MSPQQPQAAKRPPAIGHASADGMVTVVVGLSKTKYLIHKALLVHHSDYFTKALSGSWKEVEERLISLEDSEVEEFNLFVHWLYTQQLFTDFLGFNHISRRPSAYSTRIKDVMLLLVKAYALGDSILAPAFRRKVNNLIVDDTFNTNMSPDELLPVVAEAFSRIPSDRTVLQFFANNFCEYWEPKYDGSGDDDALAKFPPAFTIRVMRRSVYLRRGEHYGCYLEHATEKGKKSCRKAHVEFVGGGKDYGFLGEPRKNMYA